MLPGSVKYLHIFVTARRMCVLYERLEFLMQPLKTRSKDTQRMKENQYVLYSYTNGKWWIKY